MGRIHDEDARTRILILLGVADRVLSSPLTMAITLPISEVKTRLTELVTWVEECEEAVVVTRNGRPAAILLSHAEYERLKETIDVLSDPLLMRQIRRSETFYAKGKRGVVS